MAGLREANESTATLTHERLLNDLRELGVKTGDLVVVRAALRDIGAVRDRARVFTDALLEAVGADGAVLGLSFTPSFKLPIRGGMRRFVFDSATPAVTGGFANYLLSREDAFRSRHPMCSFVGIGARARALLADHDGNRPAFEPVHRLAQEAQGRMLLVGKPYDIPGISTVHVAQFLLGMKSRTEGRRGVYYLSANGMRHLYKKNYSAGCSRGFGRFYDAYREEHAIRDGTIGDAEALYADLGRTLSVDLEALRADPTFFFCDDKACRSCRREWTFYQEPMWRWIPHRALWSAREVKARVRARVASSLGRRTS